jgi:hypothetical protein
MIAGLDTISGTVTRVQNQGFLLADYPEQWLNLSRFAHPTPSLPAVGQRVTASLDAQGFVRKVDVDAIQVAAAPPGGPASTTRETTITRLAVLKAAAEFLAARPDAKSKDVVKVAEAWEAWVTRP